MSSEDIALKNLCRPIGLFDSGVGGLTVLQAIKKELPKESFVYFGDTARIPYGNKTHETIVRYSFENAAFLLERDIKALVIACNTASAHALEKLQEALMIPIFGVIHSGVQEALKISKNKKIAVLGTFGTISSGAYQRAILQEEPQAQIFAIPCPLFVPLVEEGFINHAATKLIVHEYLAPLKYSGVDTLLLGCTHYPLLKDVIEQEVGAHVQIVDSALMCARFLSKAIGDMNLVSSELPPAPDRFYVSEDPFKFKRLAKDMLGIEPEGVYEVKNML